MRSPATDRRVFVDSSAYYAAVDRGDAGHAAVVATMRRLVDDRRRLVTTNAILFELHSLLLNRLGRHAAFAALTELRASQTVVRVRPRDEVRAEAILVGYDDKEFSLTDALSFAVMERLGIGTAFTLDRHFAQFGWVLLPLEEAAQTGR
ncbi:MAG TPA: PIN domain-containing protein [Thermomicrobiales bacterium]|jgi:predicted nucleic acid-binding protein